MRLTYVSSSVPSSSSFVPAVDSRSCRRGVYLTVACMGDLAPSSCELCAHRPLRRDCNWVPRGQAEGGNRKRLLTLTLSLVCPWFLGSGDTGRRITQ